MPEWARNPDGSGNVSVVFHKDLSFSNAQDLVRKYNGIPVLLIEDITVNDSTWFNSLVVIMFSKDILNLAKAGEVVYIEEVPPRPQIYK